MPLLQLVMVLIVVGVLLWLVNRFIPMQGTIKSILNAVVVIAVVLWLLNVFGLFRGLSGIRVDRIKMFAFATSGFCAALTGILLSSLLGSGTLAAADGYLLDAFAAVFLGSATLREGQFHIVGTLVGVLVLAVGFNGLSIFGAPTFFQPIFKGGVLILAVGLSALARRYAARV